MHNMLVAVGLSCALLGGGLQAQERELRLVETARYGSVDGEAALTAINALLLAPDETMYIAQRQEAVVRVFSTSGELRATLGRRGHGPGEYQRVEALGWHRDSLTVYDPESERHTLVDPEGTGVRTIGPARGVYSAAWAPAAPAGMMRDGSAVVVPHAQPGSTAEHRPIIRYSGAAGTELTRISRGGTHYTFRFGEIGGAVSRQPASSAPLWALHPWGDGLVVLAQPVATASGRHEFQLHRIGADGRTLFRKAFAYTPLPLTQATADSIVSNVISGWYSRIAAITPVDRAELEEGIRAGLKLPAFWPVARRLLLGSDGSIWLERHGGGPGSHTWDVIAPDGRFHGQLEISSAIELHHVSLSEVVAASKATQYDVPIAIRYRVE